MKGWIRALWCFAFLAPTAMAAPNQLGGQGGGGGGLAGILGPGGPCSDFNAYRDIPFIEEFTQPFTTTSTAAFVNGTDDAEWENAGVVVTAVGTPNNFQLTGNSNKEFAGTLLFQAGEGTNEGFNLQFINNDTCLGAASTRCHMLHTPTTNMAVYGGHDLCWVARFGVFIFDPASEAFDSSLVVGMVEADPAIQTVATGALTRASAGGLWASEGFLFHLSRTGNLTANLGNGSTHTVMGTVDIGTYINDNKTTHGYPAFFDVGMRIHQNATGVDANNGTAQAWYRIVHFKSTVNTEWTRLGAQVSGVDALPYIDPNESEVTTLEFIQSATDAQALPEFGLEVFLSHVGGFYTREEMTDDDTAGW